MKAVDPAWYHKLYGVRKPRAVYYKTDFIDYALMLLLSAGVMGVLYGFRHGLTWLGIAVCVVELVAFAIRHGVELRVPLILRKPQDVLYMFLYKLQNLRPLYFAGLGLLLVENAVIALTPGLPHYVEWTRIGALGLFYLHFLWITVYRTVILVAHLRERKLVHEVLMQTPWKRVIHEDTNIVFEMVHAYCTGLVTHIVLIAPWYFVITHAHYSLLFLVAAAALDLVIHVRWMETTHNSWFYRDHWLGHNSELEFVWLHGTHHDAIPSGMIAVAGNGILEGCLRHSIGTPAPFYSPLAAFFVYMYEVKNDIDLHQYIPGVFPKFGKRMVQVTQHSTHHYGQLEPYGMAMKLDLPDVPDTFKNQFKWMTKEITNSIHLDEELNGFRWDNPTHRQTRSLYEKYQPTPKKKAAAPPSEAVAPPGDTNPAALSDGALPSDAMAGFGQLPAIVNHEPESVL